MASQVSWAASLSRLRKVASIALKPAEMVHVGDDAFAGVADDRRDNGDAAGRHVDDLARKFAPVGQHVAPEQINLDALVASALLGQRQRSRLGQGDGHDRSGFFLGANSPSQ